MPVTINGTTGIAGVDGSASTPAVQGTDTNTGIAFPAADTVTVATGGSERMRIDSSGNVGINSTSPSTYGDAGSTGGRNVVIQSTGTGRGVLVFASECTGGADDVLGKINFIDSDSTNTLFRGAGIFGLRGSDANSAYLRFDTANSAAGTERARITSGGYFKASNNGSYVSSTGTYHELCQSDDTASTIIRATNTTYSYTGGAVRISIARNTTNGSFNALVYYNEGAAASKFIVADSGNVTNTNGTYGTISDAKLKQDIIDATPQWDDIKNLRFRKYRLKNEVELDPDAKPFLGLIAQEAELICPGLIEEQKDYEDVEVSFVDEAGNSQTKTEMRPTGTTTKSIKTSILYMKAVKALQEAQLRIETLEAQNAAFEARLAALEAK